MSAKIGVVFNPNSKKNRRDPARRQRLEVIVGDTGEVFRTEHVDAIADVVHHLLDEQVPYWVADGGDGAYHWLVNVAAQVVRARGKGELVPPILPTKSGTIDFLARKVELEGNAESLLKTLVERVNAGQELQSIEVDTLRLQGKFAAASEQPGARFDRIGFAAAIAGVGQRFFDKFYANGNLGALGVLETVGRVIGSAATRTFPLRYVPMPTSVRSYADSVFQPALLDVTVDGIPLDGHEFRAINAGAIDINLARLFRLFPLAAERGAMHLILGNPQLMEVIRLIPLMARGASLADAGLKEVAARSLIVRARSGTLDPVIDGELFYGLEDVDVSLGPPISILTVREAESVV